MGEKVRNQEKIEGVGGGAQSKREKVEEEERKSVRPITLDTT